MTPLLHPSPSIAPLASISPSTFGGAACVLRLALSAAHQMPLLPSSPHGMFGSLVHLFRERAPICAKDEDALLALWERCEAKVTANECARNPLQKRFLPLAKHVKGFTDTKWREVYGAQKVTASVASVTARREESFASQDGVVRGKIDLILSSLVGEVVRDFKTGSVWEDEATRTIKVQYQTQMQLYAALFFEQEHKWPPRLELVPSQGEGVEVEFEPGECLDLLQSAKDKFKEWNIQIAAAQSSATHEALATPGAHCGFCPFRPVCPAYWNTQPEMKNSDVRGQVESVQQLGNDHWQLELRSPEDALRSVVLPDDANFWAAQGRGKQGQQAEIYGLQKGDEARFEATVLTLVFLGK